MAAVPPPDDHPKYTYMGQVGLPYTGPPGQGGAHAPRTQYAAPGPAVVPPPPEDGDESDDENYAPNSPSKMMTAQTAPPPQYQDKWCAVFFVLHVLAIAIVAFAIGLPALKDGAVVIGRRGDDDDNGGNATGGSTSDNNKLEVSEVVMMLSIAAAAGALMSAVWVWFLRRYAESLITCTLWASIAILVAVSVVVLVVMPLAAIPFLLFAALSLCFWFYIRRYIPFASANLRVAALAIQTYPATVCVAYVALVAQIAWVAIWAMALAGIVSREVDQNDDDSSNEVGVGNDDDDEDADFDQKDGVRGLIAVAMLLSFYWSSQVIRNTLHCVVAGTVGTWWAAPDSTDPTLGSTKRALTTSFGSICFGAGVIAVIQTLRAMINAARRRARGGVCLALMACLIRLIERAAKYLNAYAMCQVALFGKDFWTAGKDTYHLFRRRGWTALMSDTLIDRALTIGALMVGAITGVGSAAISLIVVEAAEGSNKTAIIVVTGIMGFIVGYMMCLIVSGVVESAVKTVFVSFAEFPEALEHTNPQEFYKLLQAWRTMHPEYLESAGYLSRFNQSSPQAGGNAVPPPKAP